MLQGNVLERGFCGGAGADLEGMFMLVGSPQPMGQLVCARDEIGMQVAVERVY